MIILLHITVHILHCNYNIICIAYLWSHDTTISIWLIISPRSGSRRALRSGKRQSCWHVSCHGSLLVSYPKTKRNGAEDPWEELEKIWTNEDWWLLVMITLDIWIPCDLKIHVLFRFILIWLTQSSPFIWAIQHFREGPNIDGNIHNVRPVEIQGLGLKIDPARSRIDQCLGHCTKIKV